MQKQGIQFDDTEVAFASKSNNELKKSHFVFTIMRYPWIVQMGMSFTRWALRTGLPIKGIIKKTIFDQFCGGESIEGCADTIKHLGDHGVKTILDYSVEGESNEMSFDDTCAEIIKVCKSANKDPNVPFSVVKPTGIGPLAIMTKVQAGESLKEIEKCKLEFFQERANELAQTAIENNTMFLIDAEEVCMQEVVDEVTYNLMVRHNKCHPMVYNTYQLYRKDALANLQNAVARARFEGFHLGAKLVRGAYIEKERERALEMGYEDPIQPNKESTDRDYNTALEFCIKNIDVVGLCAGTHNEESSNYLVDLIEEYGIKKSDPRVYFAQLLGMSDNISFNLASQGYNVAKYVPYGPVEKVMPYLFRRAEENTAMGSQTGRELSLIRKEINRRSRGETHVKT